MAAARQRTAGKQCHYWSCKTQIQGIAIDGKALRGIHGEEMPGVRLVAAYAQEAGLVLGQKGGQERQEGERTDSGPSLAGPT